MAGVGFAVNIITDKTLEQFKKDELFAAQAYLDHGGNWAYGYGHSTLRPPFVKEGDTITEPDALALLKADLEYIGLRIAKKLTVEIDDGKYGVLCSLAYNGGVSALLKSDLFAMVNNKEKKYHFGYAALMILDYKVTAEDKFTGVRRKFLGLGLRRVRESFHFQEGGVE